MLLESYHCQENFYTYFWLIYHDEWTALQMDKSFACNFESKKQAESNIWKCRLSHIFIFIFNINKGPMNVCVYDFMTQIVEKTKLRLKIGALGGGIELIC